MVRHLVPPYGAAIRSAGGLEVDGVVSVSVSTRPAVYVMVSENAPSALPTSSAAVPVHSLPQSQQLEFDESEHSYYTGLQRHNAYTKTPESESPGPAKRKSQNVPECPSESYFLTKWLLCRPSHVARTELYNNKENATECNMMQQIPRISRCYRKVHSLPHEQVLTPRSPRPSCTIVSRIGPQRGYVGSSETGVHHG